MSVSDPRLGRVARLAALLGAGSPVAAMLWWRLHPSACPYSQRFWLEPPHPLITRARLRDLLEPRPGEEILEIGPGTGYYTLPLAEWIGPTGRLDIVDVQQAMLDDTMRRARDRGVENITPTCADAQHLPYPDGAASLGEAAAFDDGAAIPLGADVSRSASRLPLGECGGAVLDRRLAAREHDRVRPHTLLLDIDGVLYVEDEPVGGAVAAVARLRAAGCALRFVTNTTNRTRAATLAKLLRLGFAVADSELITPAALAVRVCRERGHRRVALFVAEGVEVDFAGLEQVDGAHADGAHADAVIVGDLGEAWDYAALNAAFRLAMDGAELIALQKNRYWQRADGLSLDVGPFVAALEYATGREATVVGKPAAAFFEQALADAGAAAGDTVMVGDDVESDVGGALRAGLAGILVRTGKYREEIVRASGIEPTATVDSIADVPALVGA